jgi:large subunit ribosomal protein L16
MSPKRTKYRKSQKGKQPIGISLRCNKIDFGTYALKSIESGKITARQIEATRKAIVRKTKRTGKLWIRIFPDIPVTRKPIEVRMGKGKGMPEFWMCKIKAGRVLFELDGISHTEAEMAFSSAMSKLPVKTKFIYK